MTQRRETRIRVPMWLQSFRKLSYPSHFILSTAALVSRTDYGHRKSPGDRAASFKNINPGAYSSTGPEDTFISQSSFSYHFAKLNPRALFFPSTMSAFIKKIPESILIFGAAGHIGWPLAEFLTREAPAIKIRLTTSSPQKRGMLQAAFPKAHVVDADYNDVASLSKAVAGIEGVFVITPNGMLEAAAMSNLATALKKEKSLIQVIRLVGVFPEFSPTRVPKTLGHGSLPIEHPTAKRILDESGLPVTYINSGATFIDNLWLQIAPVLAKKTLIWPEHRVPFIDPDDIAEVAGRLFLSDNAKHIGAFHTMNNGHDWLQFKEVAEILSEVLGEPIAYDGSYEAFSGFYGSKMGPVLDPLWAFFKFEEANEVNWALNNFVERTLGRKPTTVRQWVLKHKDELLRGKRTVPWAEHQA